MDNTIKIIPSVMIGFIPCLPKWWTILTLLYVLLSPAHGHVSGDEYMRGTYEHNAFVNITYKDPVTGEIRSEKNEIGMYGMKSRKEPEWGIVVHVRTANNTSTGCSPPVNVPSKRWIALIERGSCKFTIKIYNAAVLKNASAVVIYNHNKEDDSLLTMDYTVDDVVSIFMSKEHGDQIAALVDNGTEVMMNITAGSYGGLSHNPHINKTSVLFVSISFIVLMMISLGWLVFYYIQRFRYAHAKERLSKRLMHAAKKAISKMPVRTLKNGDKETESEFDQCAVCIEGYKVSEVIRILPCKHLFHKSCVDPWLVEQRSCPMCKLDILKAYGLQIHGSHESIVNIEVEGPSTSLGPFEILSTDPVREFDNNGVEVIRFQPAQVDYHYGQSEAEDRGARPDPQGCLKDIAEESCDTAAAAAQASNKPVNLDDVTEMNTLISDSGEPITSTADKALESSDLLKACSNRNEAECSVDWDTNNERQSLVRNEDGSPWSDITS